MLNLDYVGDQVATRRLQEAIVYPQLGQQPLVRTTETSPEPGRGTLSCLSAQPPDLPFWTGTRSRVVGQRVPEHFYTPIEHFYTPIALNRTAAARTDPSSLALHHAAKKTWLHRSRDAAIYAAARLAAYCI